MSLRTRLTLLFTLLVGGIFLLLGVIFYHSVYFTLYSQIDQNLIEAYQSALPYYQKIIGGTGGLSFSTESKSASGAFYYQFWGKDGKLRQAWPSLELIDTPLDPINYRSTIPVFNNSFFGNKHFRVLTVPLIIADTDLGTLQAATDLSLIDSTLQQLLWILMVGLTGAMFLTALAAWYTTHQALMPLNVVTEIALQITQADDLSRRIPIHGLSENDEIGKLITAFNQTLQRLERLFQTQNRFLADVGHELRTPLTVIKGNVSLMRRMNVVDQEALDSIESEADRLTRLVSSLLILAQAEAGQMHLDKKVVELDSLIFEIIQQLKILSTDRVHFKIGEVDQLLVCGDRDRLKQVWVNLISNAVNYSPQGGTIEISMKKDGDFACVSVKDEGQGIPPEDIPHIFERFYRAEKSRTRSSGSKGFGLGLSIAYWIVHHHGGRIEVQSKEGEGSTFIVWLPLVKDSACEAAA